MPSTSRLLTESKAAPLVKMGFESMRSLISPDLYKAWKKRIFEESKKVGAVISEGKKVVRKIPKILPDKKD